MVKVLLVILWKLLVYLLSKCCIYDTKLDFDYRGNLSIRLRIPEHSARTILIVFLILSTCIVKSRIHRHLVNSLESKGELGRYHLRPLYITYHNFCRSLGTKMFFFAVTQFKHVFFFTKVYNNMFNNLNSSL